MTTIAQVYKDYHIPPHLQLHMYRVAAVARHICNHCKTAQPDTTNIVSACLIHDCGNTVRDQFGSILTDLYPDGETEYWKAKAHLLQQKYGTSDHHANLAIAEEIGVSQHTRKLIDGIRSENVGQRRDNLNQIIVHYADLRVNPYSIDSIHARFKEIVQRYPNITQAKTNNIIQEHGNALKEETFLFTHTTISPNDIGEHILAQYQERLEQYILI